MAGELMTRPGLPLDGAPEEASAGRRKETIQRSSLCPDADAERYAAKNLLAPFAWNLP